MIAPFLGGLESVFGWLLEASWQASVLAGLVLGLQWLLREKLNPRWYHALWLLVIARLLLPTLPESALSLFQFAPKPPVIVTQTVTEPIFAAPPEAWPAPPLVSVPSVRYPWSVFTVLALTWLVGALALSLLTWRVNRRFARHVAATRAVDDPRLLDLAATARDELAIRHSVRRIESPRVHSPAIMGLFRPTLILPGEVGARFSDDELRFIFLHEFAHLKRGDLFLQWVIALLQILHWFNPVLWYAFRRARIDREPATDALVLSRAGESQKESYGGVLVKLLEHHQARYALPTLVGILEDKDQFQRRFSLIARFTRGAYGWSLLGIVLIGALTAACLTKGLHSRRPIDPTLPAVIDLTSSYTRVFLPDGSDSMFNGYAGRKTIDGLPFDINGKIPLFGKENEDRGKDYAYEVLGIKIDHKFDELHLVHAWNGGNMKVVQSPPCACIMQTVRVLIL
jgi:beta-lactamase regulating signal transducer with metallopeptidase domain